MTTETVTTESVERELAELLEVERIDPPEDFVRQANITDRTPFEEADADFQAFWLKQATELLDWESEPKQALDDSNPPFYKWFEDGRLNASYNCLDRHIEAGRGDRVAYHWRGEEGEERDVTYADLHRDVQRLANALKERGIGKGDVVGIYLPMIPEVVTAMLACARIGAPHNVVFGGFSAGAVGERMEFSEARALITADEARRAGKATPVKAKVDEVMGDVDSIETIVVVRNTGGECPMSEGRDVWYHEVLEAAADECPPEPLDAEHPLYILYTSGSTAKPKGILHTTGGYLAHVAWTHRYVFDLQDDSVYWCAADVGWVTGHSYIVYGPLANGATSVMWEGAPNYPDKDIWWEIAERYGVTILYCAPTAIRTHMKWGPEYAGRHDLSSLRILGTVGEPINPKAWLWYRKVIGGDRCPIVDTWWQTETGGIMITTLPGVQAMKPGSAGTPLPGFAAKVLTDEGEEAERDTQGLLTLQRPWPGMLRTLYREEDRFVETYFEKFGRDTYLVGDASRQDADGYFWIVGRVDDVINVSGHRMSTAEIESAIVSHSNVAESAVIGQTDEHTGQTVCAFVTLEGDLEGSDDLVEELRDHVGHRIGKFARPSRVIWANELPKTRSGKIMRRLLRDIADGRALGDVTTLADPTVMEKLEEKIAERQGEE